jgi:integrase
MICATRARRSCWLKEYPPELVMDVLGHSQIALTMNTYTHVLPELKQDATKRMNDLMLER